jgi:hypothetical protein
VFEGEPCTNFVKEKIRVLSEEVFNSREESSSDDSSRAFQRRRWLVDSPKFIKDAAPTIAAVLRNTECITDVFHIPTMIPESKRALLEIWAYLSVNHSIYASDFDDFLSQNALAGPSEIFTRGFPFWSRVFENLRIIIICALSSWS